MISFVDHGGVECVAGPPGKVESGATVRVFENHLRHSIVVGRIVTTLPGFPPMVIAEIAKKTIVADLHLPVDTSCDCGSGLRATLSDGVDACCEHCI